LHANNEFHIKIFLLDIWFFQGEKFYSAEKYFRNDFLQNEENRVFQTKVKKKEILHRIIIKIK